MYIRKFNNKWVNDFNKSYLDNLNKLIEAFTIFYGNSYYKYIKGVITKLKFHFFINEEALVHVVDKDDNLMINKINSHVNTLKRLEKCDIKNGMTKTQVGFRCMKRFVYTKFGRKSLEYEMWRDLMFEPSLAIYYTNNLIALPIYTVDDNTIIHEINHAFNTPDNIYNIFPYAEIDELLNEITALDILDIFKSLGGKIVHNDIKLNCLETSKVYLIKDFYLNFKDLVSECLIMNDYSVLEDNLGSNNLMTYFSFVVKLYNKKEVNDIELKRLKFLVFMMKEYYKNKQNRRTRKIL